MRACDAANGMNRAWEAVASNGELAAYAACPSGGDRARGLVARNAIQRNPRSAVRGGAVAAFRFTAPAGTAIVGVRAGFHFYRADGRWEAALLSDGHLIEGCAPGGGVCERDASNRAVRVAPSRVLSLEARCAARSCPTGSTGDKSHGLIQASANFYSVTVRLQDNSPPRITDLGGSLLSPGWHSGIQSLTFVASDSSGISETRVRVDGRGITRNVQPCDSTRVVPCPEGPDAFSVETSTVRPDGLHVFTVEAVDAAGNLARTSERALVDNTPPGPPVFLGVEGGEGWRSSNQFAAAWQSPAADGGAPVTGAAFQLCPAGGGACPEGERDGPTVPPLGALAVPSPGDWLLRVWLRDAAGNADPRTAAGPVHLRFDNEPPAAAFVPQDPQDPTRVVVTVSDHVSGVASGSIEIKKATSTRWRALPSFLAGGELSAVIDDEHLQDGVYDLRATVLDQAGNSSSTDRRPDGSPAAVTLPLRLETRLRAGIAHRVHARRHRHLHTVLRSTARVPFGRRVRISGRLSSRDGTPLPHAQVLVFQRTAEPGATWTPLARVQTAGRGTFAFIAPRGVSRLLRFRYPGASTVRAATADVGVEVAAVTSLRVSDHRVRTGRSVRFSGRLRGGHVPAGGKLIELQARVRGRWQTFATTQTNARGQWRYRYGFTAPGRGAVYRFRARVPYEAAYAYSAGGSRAARVRVD